MLLFFWTVPCVAGGHSSQQQAAAQGTMVESVPADDSADDVVGVSPCQILQGRDPHFNQTAYDALTEYEQGRLLEASQVAAGRKQPNQIRAGFVDGLSGIAGLFFDPSKNYKAQPGAQELALKAV